MLTMDGTARTRIGALLALVALLAIAPLASVGVLAQDAPPESEPAGDEAPGFPPLGQLPATADATSGVTHTLSQDGRRASPEAEPERAGPLRFDEVDGIADYQRVFPPDERERVPSTTSFPASAIAFLEQYDGDNLVTLCTGTFIGPDVVLTAGHCVYYPPHGFGTGIAVVPGVDGDDEPFGYQWAAEVWVPEEWFRNRTLEWDWALIRLPNSDLGNQTGWLQIGALSDESLAAPNLNPTMYGYPFDKPSRTMWSATLPAFHEVEQFLLSHHLDTFQGQSGAAIWRGSDRLIVGIHFGSLPNTNLASRIDNQMLDDLLQACAGRGCQFSYSTETPRAEVSPSFALLTPGPFTTVPPGGTEFVATATSSSDIVSMTLRAGGQEFTSTGPNVSGSVFLSHGVYVIEAHATDSSGSTFRTMWDVVVSDDPNETAWFTASGQPKDAQINATMRSLVEAFRWHLFGQTWDGSIPDMPTHVPLDDMTHASTPGPWVTDGEFDQAATEATMRSLVEAFRWHFWGRSWEPEPKPDVPTHSRYVRGVQTISPWFEADGTPRPEAIEATLRSLVEAFRWHFWGYSWDGGRHLHSMPTHGYEGWD
jgi:V8-like Glu-specific endopeptidase